MHSRGFSRNRDTLGKGRGARGCGYLAPDDFGHPVPMGTLASGFLPLSAGCSCWILLTSVNLASCLPLKFACLIIHVA